MRSRSLLMILVIGVVGMVAMGFLTKFVFDSDKGLQAVTKIKVDLAKEFKDEGIERVSLRKRQRPRTIELRLTADPQKVQAESELHRSVAEFVATAMPKETAALNLVYIPESHFGCSSPEPFVAKQFSLRKIRNELAVKQAVERLRNRFASLQLDLEHWERKLPDISVRARARNADALELTKLQIDDLGRMVVRELRGSRKTKYRVSVFGPQKSGAMTPRSAKPAPGTPEAGNAVSAGGANEPRAKPALYFEYDFRGKRIK